MIQLCTEKEVRDMKKYVKLFFLSDGLFYIEFLFVFRRIGSGRTDCYG